MHMYVREEHIHIHCTCQRLRRTMTLLTFAFPAFFITVSLAENVERDAVESPLFHFQLANVGEDVALSCSCRSINAFEYCWFKQGLERSPLFVTKIYSLNHNGSFSEQFNSPRFSVDIKESNYQLKISNLKISDSATYYCLAKNLKSAELCEGTTLSVKGSSFTISASLPRSKTIQPEEPETLSCTVESLTCSGEHSVYWFRESGASHRGLIYTQRGSNDQCVRKPKTQTATCEYNLPLEKLNTSNSGTYYCAVVACGHIMFGERDTMDIGHNGDVMFLVYALAAVSTFTSLVAVWLSFSLYKMKRNFRSESTAGHPTAMGLQDASGIYCEPFNVDVPSRREERSDQESKCVYSLLSR